MRHVACLRTAVLAALVGLVATQSMAWAQDTPEAAAVVLDPGVLALIELVKGGGLPVVLAWVAWWLRGLMGAGIPVTVQLSDVDRALLRDARRDLDAVGRLSLTDPGSPR